jgi:hypothetical protein
LWRKADVHDEMKARVATFVQTNLGRKWRKWLLTMDITDPEKKKIALGMIIAVHYPSKGAVPSKVRPWVAF